MKLEIDFAIALVLFNLGQVHDLNAPCACRNCTAGECICGNGRLEPGEQCDLGGVIDPCCVNCQYTRNPCNDTNGCTAGDTCNGAGVCIGDYKCPPSSDCATVTCSPQVGTCDVTPFADNTGCGGLPYNLCQKRCISGVCNTTATVCATPPNSNASICHYPVCVNTTGDCILVPQNGGSCSDSDPCTINDQCYNGVCKGAPMNCSTTNVCGFFFCSSGVCIANNTYKNGVPCDDGYACTIGDHCTGGKCVSGIQKTCNTTDQCKLSYCNSTNGNCVVNNVPNNQKTCDDLNICTINDVCVDGECTGTLACNGTTTDLVSSTVVKNNSIIIFSVAGAAAVVGAIIGMAFLAKKIRDSKLTDPDTWNPDMFSSVGANPLYKGSAKTVDNRLYEQPVN